MSTLRTSAAFKQGYLEGYGDAENAYGKCHYCYGKGYSTMTSQRTGKKRHKPCECARGKEIKEMISTLKKPV